MSRTSTRQCARSDWQRWPAMIVIAAALLALTSGRSNAIAASASIAARFHAALSNAEPGINDTVATSPKLIKLWFTEPVEAAATAIRLTGSDGRPVAVGAATVNRAPKSPAIIPVRETLKPGTYTVAWKTMAADGHPSNGNFVFTLR